MRGRDRFYYVAGLGFLALAKAKHLVHGYSTPKTIGASEVDRCVEYDLRVVAGWLDHLRRYSSEGIDGKDVLELGPGSDIGTGIVLLARGCSTYNACDVHDLAASASDVFYERLFERLEDGDGVADLRDLEREVAAARRGMPSRLHYVVRKDFDLVETFGKSSIDLVVSQAAFEHFDDVEKTVEQLDQVCRPRARIVAEIDLMTHSRWIRDKDPNNIYRYSPRVYDFFHFRGSPNRVRPFQYQHAFERRGWTNVTITPLTTTQGRARLESGLSPLFANEKSRMDVLTFVLCATKGA
ncbi:MAG TPA: methyltransferase domain-containing protein [Gammaproteobacteria bacterium]|nr:methyltransferase domain-containing protein [Gammaproteobacteria bacterium]